MKNWLATISDFENVIASLKNWLATISDFENLIATLKNQLAYFKFSPKVKLLLRPINTYP